MRPFVGASGNLLKRMWADPSITALVPTPIRREDVYIDNFCPWLPESRHIESLSEQEMIECRNALLERLARLSSPVVIVPTGNYACWALVGKGNVKGVKLPKMDKVGITSLRGSIYALQLNGRVVKVIPTLHPSAVFNRGSRSVGATKGSLEKRSVCDWRRIAIESLYEGFNEPRRIHCVDPMEQEVAAFYNLMRDNPECAFSVDIENRKNRIVGKLDNIYFMECTTAKTFTDGGASANVAGQNTIIIGKGAFAVPDIEGSAKPEMVTVENADSGNPLKLWKSIGWKSLFTAMIKNQYCVLRIETTTV